MLLQVLSSMYTGLVSLLHACLPWATHIADHWLAHLPSGRMVPSTWLCKAFLQPACCCPAVSTSSDNRCCQTPLATIAPTEPAVISTFHSRTGALGQSNGTAPWQWGFLDTVAVTFAQEAAPAPLTVNVIPSCTSVTEPPAVTLLSATR